MSLKLILLVALAGFTLFYLGLWWSAWRERSVTLQAPTALQALIGFVTNFFDTLGIGSFATTTSLFRFFKMIDDRVIPGTLNVGHTLPTITQAFIYITIVEVDITTLVALIIAAVLGAWLGAGVVSSWNAQKVRLGMGLALLAAAGFFLMRQLELFPAWGATLELSGARRARGGAGNFALGALMSLGIGLYAPCMILVSLLGMRETAAFPIMMGSCAFLMPVGSAAFVRARSFDARTALGLGLGGIPAVLIAALIVKSLPLYAVRWLVIVVVLYTALTMLHSAFKARPAAS
jgi:uncharacterized membrane protein YfcA